MHRYHSLLFAALLLAFMPAISEGKTKADEGQREPTPD